MGKLNKLADKDLNVPNTIETRLPTGVKDFLPVKTAKLDYLQNTLRGIYRSWGISPCGTCRS